MRKSTSTKGRGRRMTSEEEQEQEFIQIIKDVCKEHIKDINELLPKLDRTQLRHIKHRIHIFIKDNQLKRQKSPRRYGERNLTEAELTKKRTDALYDAVPSLSKLDTAIIKKPSNDE